MSSETDSKSPIVTHNGKEYMTDAKGALVPIETIPPVDILMDEMVRKILGHAGDLAGEIGRFKGHTFEDVSDFQALLAQDYDKKIGGRKGNITLTSFDGCNKVQVQVSDLIMFGPEMQVAKDLIDECLSEWAADSGAEIRALVTRVFQVDKEGEINRAELFMLMRVEIKDERWNKAMDAIRNSIRVIGSKTYLRFYTRPAADAQWKAVPIDLAAAA